MIITIAEAINCNCVGTLRILLDKYYYNTNTRTMTNQMVENIRMSCIYRRKDMLLGAFRVPPVVCPAVSPAVSPVVSPVVSPMVSPMVSPVVSPRGFPRGIYN